MQERIISPRRHVAFEGKGVCASSCHMDGSVRTVVVRGPVSSGKTAYLADVVRTLTLDGTPPQSVCTVTATSNACEALRDRLLRLGLPDGIAASVVVLTPSELFARVLDRPDIRRATGRVPRVANALEQRAVLQGLRAQHDDAKELARSLRRVERAAATGSELSPEDERTRDALSNELSRLQAMMRFELAPTLIACLEASAELRALAGFDAVLVDGFQNLSAAAQRACELLARSLFVAAGDVRQTVPSFDHANPQALVDFESSHPGCRTVLLPELSPRSQVRRFVDELCAHDVASEQSGSDSGVVDDGAQKASGIETEREAEDGGASVTVLKCREPHEEFSSVAALVGRFVERNPDLDLSKIYVAVPNDLWAHGVAAALAKWRLQTSVVTRRSPLEVAMKSPHAKPTLRAVSALALAADPDSALAWRTWAFLDDDTSSEAWTALSDFAAMQDTSLVDALSTARKDATAFPHADELAKCWQTGTDRIAELRRKAGFGLVKTVVDEGGEALAKLCEPVEGDETVSSLFARVARNGFDGRFERSVQRVLVGPYERIEGLSPRFVFLTGMVDGMLPANVPAPCGDPAVDARRAQAIASCRRIVANAAGKARDALFVSYPQQCDLELAQRLKLDVKRTRRRDGRHLAVLRPSPIVSEARGALPCTMSSEQLLADEPSAKSVSGKE